MAEAGERTQLLVLVRRLDSQLGVGGVRGAELVAAAAVPLLALSAQPVDVVLELVPRASVDGVGDQAVKVSFLVPLPSLVQTHTEFVVLEQSRGGLITQVRVVQRGWEDRSSHCG